MALSVYTSTGIIHETSVDFTKRVLAEPVHLVQYDTSLPVIAVTCLDAGQYMTLTASDTVSIRMDKGDGTFIYNPALGMSADGHKVYVQITEQMTVNYGRFEPVLELLRGNGYGCSSPIPMFIDKNPVSENEIESTSEYGTIIEIRNEVQEMKDETQEIIDSSVMTFDEAATRENINSGESLSTIMGKIKKWFADLKNAAFHTVANNYTTTAEGYVLDARLGPAIKAKMDLADTLDTKVNNMNTANYRLYASRNGTVEYGTWNTIADIDIPADDTHVWLVLGMSYDNISEDHIAAMRMIITPDTAGIMGIGRFAGKIGAGMNCWGIVDPGVDTARTVSLQVYGYQQTAYTAYGRLYGIAICDTRS